MANKPKRIGTRFESDCVAFLRERLGDDRIERRALRGSMDAGDIFGLWAHGFEGVIECKSHKHWGPADLEKWKSQTVAERGNADADFSLLVIHKNGVGRKRFGENDCYMQVRDLERVMGGDFKCLAGDSAKDMWVRVTLEEACQMIEGVREESQ